MSAPRAGKREQSPQEEARPYPDVKTCSDVIGCLCHVVCVSGLSPSQMLVINALYIIVDLHCKLHYDTTLIHLAPEVARAIQISDIRGVLS